MSVLKSVSLILRSSRMPVLVQCRIQHDVFRGLYSASTLGIDGFMQQQQKVRSQLLNIQEKFKSKMKEYTDETSKGVVFTEDLKNMIHIAEDSDINLVIKMMKKFNRQNKELRFGNYIFGPVVMRMFSVLNKPNEALECFKSPELQGFFDQLMSQQLLLDMLYEHQRYNDMLECFNIIKERQIEGIKYPRNIIVLVYAACYKLNTPESLDYATKLWSELLQAGHNIARRTVTFFAALLLNQNKPDYCLEVLASFRNQNYTTVRNLKVLSLIRLNRLQDIIPILKSILNQDHIQTFNRDVLDVVKEHMEKENNIELQTEFNHIMKIFQEQNHIMDTTLDQQLTSEIAPISINKGNTFRRQQDDRPWRRLGREPSDRQFLRGPRRAAVHDME